MERSVRKAGGERSIGLKINAVSELTGVSADVLRVWERRYNAVTPVRTPGGTRLYNDADVWRIMLLRRGVAKGHQIGQIVALTNEELEKLRRTTEPLPPAEIEAGVVGRFINFISEMNLEAAENELLAAVNAFTPEMLVEKILSPTLRRIGDNWRHGEFGVAEEHLATNVIRSVLMSIEKTRGDQAGPGVVLATTVGERHELGLMISALAAALKKWRVVYLGLETPAEEIARTVRLTNANTVGLSIAAPRADVTARELVRLDLFLPSETSVIVGGGGGDQYAAEIKTFGWTLARGVDDFPDAHS